MLCMNFNQLITHRNWYFQQSLFTIAICYRARIAIGKLDFLATDTSPVMKLNIAPGEHFAQDPRAAYIDKHLNMAAQNFDRIIKVCFVFITRKKQAQAYFTLNRLNRNAYFRQGKWSRTTCLVSASGN